MASLGHNELKTYPESSLSFPINMEPKSMKVQHVVNLTKAYPNNNAHDTKQGVLSFMK